MGLFDAVRDHLGLPPLPPLQLPDLPAGLSGHTERPETMRQILAGIGVGGLLRAVAGGLFGRRERR